MRQSKERLLKAIEGSFGIVETIAKRLGIKRKSFYPYMDRYPDIAAAVAEERNKVIELAEAKLITLVNQGNEHAIEFLLSRLGRDRGWGNEQNVTLTARDIPQPIFRFVGGDKTDGDNAT